MSLVWLPPKVSLSQFIYWPPLLHYLSNLTQQMVIKSRYTALHLSYKHNGVRAAGSVSHAGCCTREYTFLVPLYFYDNTAMSVQ